MEKTIKSFLSHLQLRETRFASFSSYRGARQICMQACDFSRYSRKKEAAGFVPTPKS
jgi:hypothetical protein